MQYISTIPYVDWNPDTFTLTHDKTISSSESQPDRYDVFSLFNAHEEKIDEFEISDLLIPDTSWSKQKFEVFKVGTRIYTVVVNNIFCYDLIERKVIWKQNYQASEYIFIDNGYSVIEIRHNYLIVNVQYYHNILLSLETGEFLFQSFEIFFTNDPTRIIHNNYMSFIHYLHDPESQDRNIATVNRTMSAHPTQTWLATIKSDTKAIVYDYETEREICSYEDEGIEYNHVELTENYVVIYSFNGRNIDIVNYQGIKIGQLSSVECLGEKNNVLGFSSDRKTVELWGPVSRNVKPIR